MRILLVEGRRWRLPAPAPDVAGADDLARAAEAAGHEVHRVPPPPRRTPPFRSVGRPLYDALHERAVAQAVRAFEPDVAVVLGVAAGTSVRLPWLLDALGVPCVVVVEAAALCHRGDLRYRGAEPCAVVDDSARCAQCCRARAPGGLSVLGACGAAATGWLGAFAPFPSENALRRRLSAVASALRDATSVWVPDAAARSLLAKLGVDARCVRGSEQDSAVSGLVNALAAARGRAHGA